MNHAKLRDLLHSGEPLPLDAAAHLERCESCRAYAALVGVLETSLPALWPESPPAPGAVARAVERVRAAARGQQPRQRLARLGQELAWVALAILVGLAVAWISGIIEPPALQPLSGNDPAAETALPLGLLDPTPTPALPFARYLEEIILAETDLNCDGSLERLTGQADSLSLRYGNPILLELTLEAAVHGETRPVLRLTTSPAPGKPKLMNPQLILLSEESCEQLLAVPLRSSSNMFGDLNIYRWNGTTMETALQAQGWPVLDPVPPGQVVTLQVFPSGQADGQCTQIQQTFVWNGNRFVQTSESERAGLVSCDNFRRTQPTGKIVQATGEVAGGRFTEILAQTDLNCDGRFERLHVERPVQSSYEYVHPKVFRLALETIGQIVWEYLPAEGAALSEPEIFSPGGCEKLLAVIEYQASDFGNLRVFRWNGKTMDTLITAMGAPPSPQNRVSALTQRAGHPFTITTISLGRFEDCVAHDLVTTYEWNGQTFFQTRQLASTRTCPSPLSPFPSPFSSFPCPFPHRSSSAS